MRSLRSFLAVLAVAALAACGGGGSGGALPAPAGDPGTRAPSGSTVVFETDTLWVTEGQALTGFPTAANGTVTPQQRVGVIPFYDATGKQLFGLPGIVDVAVAPDGTRWLLEQRDQFQGGAGWRLYALAPGASTPENVDGDDASYPIALALGGAGVLVGYRSVSGTTTIATYPYGASNAAPIRTWQTTGRVIAFAEGNDGRNNGRFYVRRANGYDVYAPTSTGCCPIRSVTITGLVNPNGPYGPQDFAVGPDDSVYVADFAGNNSRIPNPVMYVNVYRPGAGTPARRIGPIQTSNSAFVYPVIAVDGQNRLYVATNVNGPLIYRFGAQANGAAKPQRVVTDPALGSASVRAMAIGPKL